MPGVLPLRALWLPGTAVGLCIVAIGFARLAWVASRSRRIRHGRWFDVAQAFSSMYGLRRPVQLLQSDHPTLLVTWGMLSAKVILPCSADAWPDDRVRIVLAHELAHVRRRDWMVQILAEILRCVYWFNPLLWMACRQLRDHSEQACDDAVLGLGVRGPEYATHLLDLARAFRCGRRMTVPAAAMVRPSRLERRIAAMLNVDVNRRPVTRSACIATALVLLSLTVALAGLGAAAQTTTASFSGSLLDAVGRILPDVTIVLANAATGERHDAISDQAGHFQFASVPAGDYVVDVRKLGFASTQGRVTLAAGQRLQRDIALQLGSIEESVTVRSTEVSNSPTALPSQSVSSASESDSDPCALSPVGGCITPPRQVRRVRPQYPKAAQDRGKRATITIDGRIGTDGFVKDLHAQGVFVARDDPAFTSAVIDALRQWQFTPTRLDGIPMEVEIHVTVVFVPQH
jgi:TonB family protein